MVNVDMITYVNYTDMNGRSYKGPETFHIANALRDEGILDCVYVRDYKDVKNPASYPIHKIGSFIPKCRTFIDQYIIHKEKGREKSQLEFDKKVSQYIQGEVVLGLAGLPLCAKACKESGGKLIVFSTSSHPKSHQRIMEKETGKKIPLTEMENHICGVYEMADLILTRSPFNTKTLVENGIDKNKIKIIWNGVNLEKFNVGEKQDDIFRVLFIANFGILKGLQYLLKAWDNLNLPNSELLVLGKQMDDTSDILSKYNKEWRAKHNVAYLGHQNPVVHYQNSSIVVLPSLTEGSPMVLLEAMACGKPTIAFENSASPAKLSGFIVPNRDVDALAKNIKWFYDNPESLRKAGILARQEAEQYSYKAYTKKIMEEIKNVIK